jgi:hypothetical protein
LSSPAQAHLRDQELLKPGTRTVDKCRVTLVADPTAAPGAATPEANRMRAVWRAPVWAHLAVLAVVLVALLSVVGSSSSFSADEGAAIVQARSLSEGRGWTVAHPAPELDPEGVNYPLEFSEQGPQGWAPYAKHPLYPLLLAGADRLGGVTGMVLLSLAGTLAAAGLAGALARRLDPALVRPAIWVTGLASPLLVDGYLLIAHTLAAALAAGAVLAAVVAIERRRPLVALAVVPAVAGCVLLRSEGLFVAAALAAVAGVVGLRRRDVLVPAAVVALGSTAAGLGARVLDGLWTARILGSAGRAAGPTVPAAGDSAGLVEGRVQGFILTWLTPGYGGQTVTGLALLVMLAAVVVGAFTVRRDPANGRRIAGCATVASAAALLAVLAGPGTVVPGLLLAFPFAGAGLLLVGRPTLRSAGARIATAVCVLFVLAVLATQYAKGGGGEWGGRYFALALPIGVPVLLLALWDQRARLAPGVARWAMAGLIVSSVAMSTMGVSAVRASHRANARLVAAVDRAGRSLDAPAPLLLTTEGAMPRFAWPTFDRQRWLLAAPGDLGDLFVRLRAAGVTRVGFVTRNLDRDRALLDGAGAGVLTVDGSESARRWHVLVVQVAPA